MGAPSLEDVYPKGDFKGLVSAKFGTKTDRDEAVKALKKAGLKAAGDEVWAKAHRPVESRAPRSLLLGFY